MKPATYRNPWHKTVKGSPEFYTAYSDKPNKSYRGIDIYLRASGYDFVANGTCFTQRAGISRYKEVIDDILDTQNDHMNKRASRRIANNMINDLRREEA